MVLTTLKPLHYRTMVGRNSLITNWGQNKVENKEQERKGGGGGELDKTLRFPPLMIFRGLRGSGPNQGVENALVLHLITTNHSPRGRIFSLAPFLFQAHLLFEERLASLTSSPQPHLFPKPTFSLGNIFSLSPSNPPYLGTHLFPNPNHIPIPIPSQGLLYS